MVFDSGISPFQTLKSTAPCCFKTCKSFFPGFALPSKQRTGSGHTDIGIRLLFIDLDNSGKRIQRSVIFHTFQILVGKDQFFPDPFVLPAFSASSRQGAAQYEYKYPHRSDKCVLHLSLPVCTTQCSQVQDTIYRCLLFIKRISYAPAGRPGHSLSSSDSHITQVRAQKGPSFFRATF